MSKIEELINQYCPDGVKMARLEDICEILDYQRKPVSKGSRKKGDFPYYGANGIQDYVDDYIFDGSFLLIGEDGSVINKDNTPIVNWAVGKIWVNNHAHVLSERKGIALLRYIYFAIQCVDVSEMIHGVPPKLNQNNLRAICIPLPPLPIQEKIAKILDKFSLLTAELEAELDLQKKRYDYYRNRILSFDSEPSSNSVQWRPLGEIALVTKLAGFEFSEYMRYSDKGNIIALRGLNVKDGHLILNDLKYIDNSDFSKLKRSRLFKGDILFTYVGTVGQVGIVDCDDKFYLAPNVALIRSTDKYYLNPKFLVFYLLSSNFRTAQLGKLTSASSMKNITMEKIRTFLIPIPPLAEQERIVNILDRFEALVTNLSNGLPAEIERVRKQYEYYRNKLLTFPIAEQ